MPDTLFLSSEVSDALADGRPVVALESALITHGLPYPENLSVARGMQETVRAVGAVPATVAVLSGRPRVGLADDELARLAESREAHKASLRDLPILALRGGDGGTTVAAAAFIAHQAGIRVFCTGGIGGVHRGAGGDVSADLPVLSSTPIVVVSAGAKAILNLPRTWEWLETHSVPVVGYQTDEFPAFYCRRSGLPVTIRVDHPEEVASLARWQWGMGLEKALLVGVPIPAEAAIPEERMEEVICQALQRARAAGVQGQSVTPYLLGEVARLTDGESMQANRTLLLNNARVAAHIACAFQE